jgi:hypothetical protein
MAVRSDLLTVVDRFAAVALSKVREGGLLFGKTYVRKGPLFSVAGSWLFQTGGSFGYGLKGHHEILAKLLAVPSEDAANYVQKVLRDVAVEQLTQASGKDKNFFQLFLVPALAAEGIDFYGLGSGVRKWVAEKVYDMEFIFVFMQVAFLGGAAVGFHFPDEFRTYWDETFRQHPEVEWAEMYKRGIVSRPEQRVLRLEDEVSVTLRAAADWVRERAPDQIAPRELAILNELATPM